MASNVTNDTTRALRPRDVRTFVTRCMAVGRPVFIHGSPGVGKSDLIEQIGKEQNRPVIDMRLLLLDPTDLKGIPFYSPATNTMKWAQPNDLPTEGSPLSNAILFLDEMNAAPANVQAAAYQLLLNRRIGEYHLPKGVSMVCAGNKDSDKGVTFRMPTPLANRLVHVEMKHDNDDWQEWAINNGIRADVIGFLAQHKQHLFSFDPKSPDKAFATPRSWFFVNQLLDDSLSEQMNTHLVAGTVGEGIAVQFAAHRKFAAQLPSSEDVLSGKVTELAVKELSAMYSLTVSMCYTLKDWAARVNDPEDKFSEDDWNKSADNYFKFMMKNFQAEMCVLGALTAIRNYKLDINFRKVPSFSDFTKAYGKYIR